jgi:hypothetical protein
MHRPNVDASTLILRKFVWMLDQESAKVRFCLGSCLYPVLHSACTTQQDAAEIVESRMTVLRVPGSLFVPNGCLFKGLNLQK